MNIWDGKEWNKERETVGAQNEWISRGWCIKDRKQGFCLSCLRGVIMLLGTNIVALLQ